MGHAGHYISYVRQNDSAFLCFDDESVSEHPCAGAVRADILGRGTEVYPMSVRMVVYSRRSSASEPVELPGPLAVTECNKRPGAPVDEGSVANGTDAKRCKTEDR